MPQLTNYQNLAQDITKILENGRNQAVSNVNTILLQTYWEVGKSIVEFEQKGNVKAEYGKELLISLSKELKKYGKGFSRSNLQYMRLLYIFFPDLPDRSGRLTWSHYVEILGVSDELARSFYEKQCILENWSVRELKRQKQSMLFERFALGKNKEEILELSHKGQTIQKAQDIIKEPYILEFLGIPEPHNFSEAELEQKIIDNLQMFLLELGKGFTFNTEGDNEPIGIILSAEKNDIKMEYAMGGISNQMFVSKYQLYLPKPEELEAEIENFLSHNGK
jgi:predicted nuclease of restriction endonuclease-like (RecB) superfamily